MARDVGAVDSLSREERSEHMSRVRSTGNRSTELAVESALQEAGIKGWIKHPSAMLGRPDFYLPDCRLAVFVDGCFWHACPHCCRRTPASRSEFWSQKIEANRRRDNRIRRRLRSEGYHVMRVWEHEVRAGNWLGRLRRMVTTACRQKAGGRA